MEGSKESIVEGPIFLDSLAVLRARGMVTGIESSIDAGFYVGISATSYHM